jgi:hypothetical protein
MGSSVQKPKIYVEIKTPAIIFFPLKAFTWLSIIISALAINGGDNFINVFKHSFVNWDAIWYLKIAAEGYDIPRKCVFFPLMPLLVKISSFIIRDYALAGILVSNILSFFGAVFFYNLVKDSHGEKPAVAALILFLAAPTTLFYSNLYAESLFFLIAVLVFYFARQKLWLMAAISAGLASATRNYGVLLVVPLLWEFFADKTNKNSIVKAAGLALVSASGLLLYSAYLYVYYKDPLYFINAQNMWHGRDKLVPPFTTLIARLADLPGMFRLSVDEMKTNLNALYFLAAIALNIYGFRKVKGPEFIYLTMIVVFLSLQPLLMSLSRYISGIFVVWSIAAIFMSNRRNPQLWLFCATACFLIWQAVINFRWMAGIWVG